MVIDSVCTYCGVGCDISAEVEDNKIQKIFAKEEGLVSQGRLCIKGKQGWDFLTHPKRLRNARVRKAFLAKNSALFADLDMDYLEPVDHDFSRRLDYIKMTQRSQRFFYNPLMIRGIEKHKPKMLFVL